MILVTQGHERGIGLEVFFKALLMGPETWWGKVRLYAHKSIVQKHLKALGLPGEITPQGVQFPRALLSCEWLAAGKPPPSSVSMEAALADVGEAGNALFTLPTTKDDLRDPLDSRKRFLGHTEFLRARYRAPSLGMFFTSGDLHVLLLNDHLALKDVPKALTPSAFEKKMTTSLRALSILEPGIKRALVAGPNPHAGEGGLLGKEEVRLTPVLNRLRKAHKKQAILGFFPGDTLYHQRRGPHDLLVYAHHDQGLAPFKALQGTLGANITLGLPFLRLSVDHGTAFPLYGKNEADPRGAFYCLRKAVGYQELLLGKNPRL